MLSNRSQEKRLLALRQQEAILNLSGSLSYLGNYLFGFFGIQTLDWEVVAAVAIPYEPVVLSVRLPSFIALAPPSTLHIAHIADAGLYHWSCCSFRFAPDFSHTINMLSNIAPESLKRLRCIEFNFDWSKNWDANKSEWCRLLRLMADQCRHSRLFIKITVDTMDSEAARMTEEEEDMDSFMRMCYASYVDIVRSIRESRLVLQDFHLFLPLFWDLEPVLERYVMGPDYDSKRGNRYPKPGHSSDLYGLSTRSIAQYQSGTRIFRSSSGRLK
ncbi:hypothetical protein V2G26_005510 [Clonostachys chloroleuca]